VGGAVLGHQRQLGSVQAVGEFTVGNAQRIFKEINEDSDQYSINLKLPFQQWTETEGSLKFGIFHDRVDRKFNQDTFSNFGDLFPDYSSTFDEPGARTFPSRITHHGLGFRRRLSRSAGDLGLVRMLDLPLSPSLRVIGGARLESFDIAIQNQAEPLAEWYPPGRPSASISAKATRTSTSRNAISCRRSA
jgi:outer membrane receptor protein involved in Fe transport